MIARCPRCGGMAYNVDARDEHGEPDPHCISCGYRPTREPTADERGDSGRRYLPRGPKVSHGGLSI